MVFGACVLLAATVRGGRQALVLVISVARSHQVQYNPPFLQTLREMRTAPQVEHAALYHGGPLLLTTVPLLPWCTTTVNHCTIWPSPPMVNERIFQEIHSGGCNEDNKGDGPAS